MHFLCLHGMGTNSQVFEMQTGKHTLPLSFPAMGAASSPTIRRPLPTHTHAATIRYELGDYHTYSFVEGTVPHPMAPGIESLVSLTDEFFAYVDKSSIPSCVAALDDLEAYIASEGPFDAVMAFSEGVGLASMLMVRRMQQDPHTERTNPLLKCAVFFSGGVPADPVALVEHAEIRLLSGAEDGVVIEVPTAHIWGSNDTQYPTFGPVLSELCKEDVRTVVVHEGGHEVPGTRDPKAVMGAVRAIRRTVEMTLEAQ